MYCSQKGGRWTSTVEGSSTDYYVVSGNAVAGDDGVGHYHDTVASAFSVGEMGAALALSAPELAGSG